MNNEQLAKAIVAMYGCTSAASAEWTDTDEAIQQAAFKLYEQADCHAEDFACHMLVAGCDVELAANFTDIPLATVQRMQRDMAQQAAAFKAWCEQQEREAAELAALEAQPLTPEQEDACEAALAEWDSTDHW